MRSGSIAPAPKIIIRTRNVAMRHGKACPRFPHLARSPYSGRRRFPTAQSHLCPWKSGRKTDPGASNSALLHKSPNCISVSLALVRQKGSWREGRIAPIPALSVVAIWGHWMNRILLVDDDTAFADMVREFLEPEGFAVDTVRDGATAAARELDRQDLIILDVMLPGMTGFEVLKRIRQKSAVPVIMLTARGEDIDRIIGLEIGADDYVAKPVNPRELLARIRAVLRRLGARPVPTDEISVGDIRLNPSSRDAWLNSNRLDLTTAEFNLLEHLLRGAGRVVSRDELSAAAFGRNPSGRSIDRNVDTLISKLRRKLGTAPENDQRIKTVRNAGYIYAIPLAQRNAAGEISASMANAQ
jgi:DNA-binding response OmpR family regulator